MRSTCEEWPIVTEKQSVNYCVSYRRTKYSFPHVTVYQQQRCGDVILCHQDDGSEAEEVSEPPVVMGPDRQLSDHSISSDPKRWLQNNASASPGHTSSMSKQTTGPSNSVTWVSKLLLDCRYGALADSYSSYLNGKRVSQIRVYRCRKLNYTCIMTTWNC